MILDDKTIKTAIEDLAILHSLTKAYGQIASVRMKRTRNLVLRDRGFLASITKIFDEVRYSYAREVLALLDRKKTKKTDQITFLAHNGKSVAVLLSANTGLYGDIVNKTFDAFMKEIDSGGSEATIVGRHGLALFLAEAANRPYTYFDLPDHAITSEQLSDVVRHIVQYEEIRLFYGKFENVLRQTPSKLVMSSKVSVGEAEKRKPTKYLFEPTLDKILMFFESEIFASLFEQSVREGELAKYASRVLAMDKAGENIKKNLGELRLERFRVVHRSMNKKQLNSLGSRLLVRK